MLEALRWSEMALNGSLRENALGVLFTSTCHNTKCNSNSAYIHHERCLEKLPSSSRELPCQLMMRGNGALGSSLPRFCPQSATIFGFWHECSNWAHRFAGEQSANMRK